MKLTEGQKDALRARYEVWGLDAVRAELKRDEHDALAPEEVTAFAREWVAAEDMKRSRTMRSVKMLAVGVIALFVGAIAAVLAT
jgi:hypothetical protein